MARNILVVEDDSNISDLLRMYLEKEGFDVRIAYDGGRAVEEFEKSFLEQNGDNMCASLIMKRRMQGKNCNDLVGETANIIESLL